ncbi:hypothetical protein STIAU_7706 [Stigmatella aurantiaca DW4/3-1]|uniref:RHD domain-containing protein n=1 Tax=Stigmatella aurantiaca (strain DW4/3-1) TaxID=378806 RepID=Q098U0_STIAD|nr:hypothetical protein STIAU_7706 [Stigmatella aurantiaca DW4/3-1]
MGRGPYIRWTGRNTLPATPGSAVPPHHHECDAPRLHLHLLRGEPSPERHLDRVQPRRQPEPGQLELGRQRQPGAQVGLVRDVEEQEREVAQLLALGGGPNPRGHPRLEQGARELLGQHPAHAIIEVHLRHLVQGRHRHRLLGGGGDAHLRGRRVPPVPVHGHGDELHRIPVMLVLGLLFGRQPRLDHHHHLPFVRAQGLMGQVRKPRAQLLVEALAARLLRQPQQRLRQRAQARRQLERLRVIDVGRVPLALVLVEDAPQVARDGELLVGLLLVDDHLLQPLVDAADLDEGVFVLAELRVVERLEDGDHQLLEVLAPVGALPLAAQQGPGLLRHRDGIQLGGQPVRLGQHPDALLPAPGGMQHHAPVQQDEQRVLGAALPLQRGQILQGARIVLALVGLAHAPGARHVIPRAPRQQQRPQEQEKGPAQRTWASSAAREHGGHVLEAAARYQPTDRFSNFLRICFSSVHSMRPVRTLFSFAVIL